MRSCYGRCVASECLTGVYYQQVPSFTVINVILLSHKCFFNQINALLEDFIFWVYICFCIQIVSICNASVVLYVLPFLPFLNCFAIYSGFIMSWNLCKYWWLINKNSGGLMWHSQHKYKEHKTHSTKATHTNIDIFIDSNLYTYIFIVMFFDGIHNYVFCLSEMYLILNKRQL